MRKGIFGAFFSATVLPAMMLMGISTEPAAANSCANKPGAIGMSRVVEIDTTGGPRFGNMQYPDIDFLEPGEVVLTFDDGPLRKYTKAVLKALSDHCTKATFFMVGRMAVVDPEMVREVAGQGHTVALHTWSHKNLGRRSLSGSKYEFELGMSAVSKALGTDISPFFRFPYLAHSKSMMDYLRKRDVGMFSIDVDSLDFRTRSPKTMIKRVLSGLKRKGKGIILFHDIQRSTAGGTRQLLSELKKRGYKVVHTISKQRATTLPEYDKLAEKELIRRKKFAAIGPQAAPTLAWPFIEVGDPRPQPLSNKRKVKPKKQAKIPPTPKKRPAGGPALGIKNTGASTQTPAPSAKAKPGLAKSPATEKPAAPANTGDAKGPSQTPVTAVAAPDVGPPVVDMDLVPGAQGASEAKGTDNGTTALKPSLADKESTTTATKPAQDEAVGVSAPLTPGNDKTEPTVPVTPAEATSSEGDTSSVDSDLRNANFRQLGVEKLDGVTSEKRLSMGKGLKVNDE